MAAPLYLNISFGSTTQRFKKPFSIQCHAVTINNKKTMMEDGMLSGIILISGTNRQGIVREFQDAHYQPRIMMARPLNEMTAPAMACM
jgi:hypothetical protein